MTLGITEVMQIRMHYNTNPDPGSALGFFCILIRAISDPE